MIERILVGVDGTKASEAVLDSLRVLLDRRAPEIVLLRAVPHPASDLHFPRRRPWGLGLADAYVQRLAGRLARQGSRAQGRVAAGDPAEVILDQARELDVSLIAMATHGRRGASRIVLGSVAERVLRNSSLPVFLCRTAAGKPGGRPESILVPLDGSWRSLTILPPVIAFARLFGARVILLHVFGSVKGRTGLEIPTRPLESAETVLKKAEIPFASEFREGDPVAEILKAAEEAGLVAVATHGRRGLRRVVTGSVTEGVLRRSPVPLLVVKSLDARAPARGKRS